MENLQKEQLNKALIVSITPYFLEKGLIWFEENLNHILEARKTQSFFQDNTLYVEKNQIYNLSQFLRKIDELGYEKVLKVQEPGEFSQQGGIVDVFPINSGNAVRFDFLGNKIENIEVLDAKIENEEKSREFLKKKLKSQKIYSELKGLKPGDCIVHLDHGIAKFIGVEEFQISKFKFQNNFKIQISNDKKEKYYILQYAGNDKLYVPVGLERKLSRYVGFQDPKISRLGSSLWQKTKRKIKEETEKIAKELLELYATRETAKRPPYLTFDEFDSEVASTFKYKETPDQMETLKDIENDLEKEKPMDRLVCGDVGFGKTEVALRALIKAVKSGYKAVMLSPTGILANQHFQNFKERLENFPADMVILTGLQNKKEQAQTIKKIKEEKAEIIIGTHRLLSDDISSFLFGEKGLGLLVVDDEQKFGVKQKEKLRQLRDKIDVLSLSATPIPRTLYFALSSLKSISVIQTPPLGRLPIETFVLPFSLKTIKKAIENEISRGGQVYYLHNRVGTIEAVKSRIKKMFPGKSVEIIHARMKEKKILETMKDFENKKIDILIATTIIENGLDFPNVNTIIVEDAEKLGLSQAYQIRGRVGRFHKKASAYFFHSKKQLSEKTKLRLNALKEAKELGSGYKIALQDLEIRGAGNILGKEQSGNVNQVGLNLYCQMLAESVGKIKIAKLTL